MLKENEIMVGADPEVFATDNNNLCVPPIILEENGLKILKQTFRNDDPEVIAHSYYHIDEDLKIMSDGSAFELTVEPVPLNKIGKLYDEIQAGYQKTAEIVNAFSLDLSVVPTVLFPKEKYSSEKYKTACEAGCDPDMDAWDDSWICKKISTVDSPYRFGGGHFHLGIPKSKLEFYHDYGRYVVRFLSMTVGAYFTVNSPQKELDSTRMEYFGKPGKFRLPPHGIEYRSPSNAWTTQNNKNVLVNAKEWILIGLNLINHPKGEQVLDKYSENFLQAFYKQDSDALQNIMNSIKEIYYA